MENKFDKSEHGKSFQQEINSTDPQMQSLSSFNDIQIMKILEEINSRLKKIEDHLSGSWVSHEDKNNL